MNRYSLQLRLRSLFRRSQVEQELSDELRFHLEAKFDELRANGIPEAEARARAKREFGNVALHQEECRDQRRLHVLEEFWQDIRYSFRALARTPGFTAIAIASLALGIGATSALFGVIDVAVLHPLAFAGANRVVWFQEFGADHSESGGTPERLEDWQTLPAFESVAGFYGEGAVLTGVASPERLEGLRFVGPLAQVLAARTQLGRFPAADEIRNGAAVLVLSDRAWRKLFGADPGCLGRSLRLAGKSYQVIGVLDAEVRYPEEIAFWAPMPREVQATPRQAGFLAQAARLRSNTSLEQAQSQANALSTRLAQDHPATDRERTLQLQPLAEHVAHAARTSLLLFFAASLAVLLIACVNVAGLLLARGLRRQREASIRIALGAGHSRLLRLFLAESLLLAAAGCGAGILLAWLGLDFLKLALPEETPRLADAVIGPRVALFGMALAVIAAALCGLVPAWRSVAEAAAVGMKERGSRSRLRSVLVIAQLALSLTLLIASGLLANSFLHLRQSPLGFDPRRAYSFSIVYPWDASSPVIDRTAQQVLQRLIASPGVQSAGVVDRLPLHGGSQSRPILVAGADLPPTYTDRQVSWRMASSGYFPAAGIPLLSGSLFGPFQREGARECVITDQLARTLFPGTNPIGRQIASHPRSPATPEWFRIVGVVGSNRLQPADASPAAEIYIPWGADYWPMLNFVVRSSQPPIVEPLRSLVTGVLIEPVQSLDSLTAQTRAASRTRAILAGTLTLAAVLLCSIGLFALLAHENTRRTQEYGVRVALGAEPAALAISAIRSSLRLAAAGTLLGLVMAFLVSRALKSLLFEVEAIDVPTYALASLILVGMALLASALPAMRAARVDPLTALRHD